MFVRSSMLLGRLFGRLFVKLFVEATNPYSWKLFGRVSRSLFRSVIRCYFEIHGVLCGNKWISLVWNACCVLQALEIVCNLPFVEINCKCFT